MGDTGASIITTVDTLNLRQHGGSLYLVIGRDSPFKELAKEIMTNSDRQTRSGVERLIVEQCDPAISWSSTDFIFFILALHSLINCTSIHLKGLRHDSGGFPFDIVSLLLLPIGRPTSRLKELVVKNCHFDRTSDLSVGNFVSLLQQMTELERFHWEEHPSNAATSYIGSPDIMTAVLSLPQLLDIDVSGIYRYEATAGRPCLGNLDSPSLGFVQSGLCHTLRLENLCLGRSSLDSLAGALIKTNCQVKRLCVDVSYSNVSTVNSFFNVLRERTSVEKLAIGISFHEEWENQGCLSNLASCISQNTTISAMKVFKGGAANWDVKFPEKDAASFLRMLEETNHSLKYLELADYTSSSQNRRHWRRTYGGRLAPVITYFTRSNACDRKKAISMLYKTTPEDWITKLLAKDNPICFLPWHIHHVEVAYYWMRLQPGLFAKTMLKVVV